MAVLLLPVVFLTKERISTGGRVAAAGCVAKERIKTDGRVVDAGCEAEERISHPQRCCRWDSLRPVLG